MGGDSPLCPQLVGFHCATVMLRHLVDNMNCIAATAYAGEGSMSKISRYALHPDENVIY